ncbi:MAG TPA: type VI secretion system tip protein TssI/VgrG [Telluria sp.]|jgi:type VI secretion system secreted protein VgrG
MTFQPVDASSPLSGVPGPDADTPVAAARLAGSVAGMAGADPTALAVGNSALDTAVALQAGGGAQALAGGAAAIASHASPGAAKALAAAGQAKALVDAAGSKPALPQAPQAPQALASGLGSGISPGLAPTLASELPAAPLVIAEHPLAGQAVNDFATPESEFMPSPIDPSRVPAPSDEPGAGAAAGASGGAGPANFVDGTRLLRFYSPLQGAKALLIESMNGATSLSEQYVFQLNLLSKNAAIDLQDLMGKNVSVGIQQADGSEHFINGYVNSFGFTHSDGGFAFYHAEIVPWFTYLKRRVNSRIFQDETVLGVLDKIFKGDYSGLATYEFRTSGAYKPENYIVQYDETDEHFTSRLMEKYGLFYYFEHSASGHIMVISDDSCNAGFCPPQDAHAVVTFNGGNRTQDKDAVTAFTAERMLQSTKLALNTFDFKAPNSIQYVEQPTVAVQGDVPAMEIYDGNPAFAYKNKDDGKREARQRMEVLEWQAKIFHGASDCRGLIAGHSFKLLEHHWFDVADGTDNDFLVLSVQYNARNNYFQRGMSDVYRNTFSAIRRKIPYRPRRAHRPPQMPGPQTATVVGPKGTEIHTDEFGRIKVQFHWDRYGRRDERSSCWIRVSQPWAGQGWGTISIPRIGQEVIIDYLEGDPDRPVCTGRLFNADQPVPYALPGAAHMMGFKSRSTPGGGGFSEMVIHDSKGAELINIHSQKDMVTTVQNNQDNIVHGPHQTNTVSTGFHVTTVKQHIETTSETAHIHDTAKTNIELTAETAHIHQTAKTDIEAKAQTGHVLVTASTDITFQVGASKIVMMADGTISIQGVHIDIVGSSRIDLNK